MLMTLGSRGNESLSSQWRKREKNVARPVSDRVMGKHLAVDDKQGDQIGRMFDLWAVCSTEAF
jgi:hypothetical protein